VSQRADAWGELGSGKAAASRRTIPLPQFVVNALKQWRLGCRKGGLGLVFPNEKGRLESHGNAIARGWQALQLAAGEPFRRSMKNASRLLVRADDSAAAASATAAARRRGPHDGLVEGGALFLVTGRDEASSKNSVRRALACY
jgi:integrase